MGPVSMLSNLVLPTVASSWLLLVATCQADPIKHELSLEEFDAIIDDLNRTRRDVVYDYSLARRRRDLSGPFYEYNSDVAEEGPWGDWGQPSPCSRTCGGGVRTEERPCGGTRPDMCVGASKRFSSCNLEACPRSAKSFREEQCASYNNVLYERKYYDWIPYLKAPRKCELNCMPKGERFYLMQAKKVVDGTPCDEEGRRICVDGECMAVGCDGMLGSTAQEDKCRVCGGDGSQCETVTDVLKNQDLKMGYNDLLVIPAGATNIRVAEVKASNNYLALRNMTGHYYLNGNWRIDFPQQIEMAGTTFHYERKYKSGKARGPLTIFAPESIRALGPITESLYIVILYQEENPGIEFEYSLKKDAVKVTPVGKTGGYQWTQAAWGECNAPCGGGTRTREVFCSEEATFQRVSEAVCDPNLRPPSEETCNSLPCKPRWNVGEWGNCTTGNDTDCTQYQFRNVFCEQVLANNMPSLVASEQCLADLGEAPVAVKICDEVIADEFLVDGSGGDPSGPRYHVGPWTGCSVICGDGIRTRDVTCYKKTEEGEVVVLEASDCPAVRPPIEEPCSNEKSCTPVDWIITDVTACEGTCGLTHRSMHAICTDVEGTAVAENETERCSGSELPSLVEPCEDVQQPAACAPSWWAAQWSDCSSKCADVVGVQTRLVFCGTMAEDGTITNTTEDQCQAELKYNATQACMGTEECTGSWFASSWGACSQECGGGKKNRKVFCIKGGKAVAPDQCVEDQKFMEEDDCNEAPCGEGSGMGDGSGDGECEYYDDWWIFGSGNGSAPEENLVAAANSNGDSDGEEGSGEGSGSGKEIDLSLFSRRCKPPPVEPCANTTYGCCPDGFFAAAGPFNEGCAEYRTCEDTQWGCCRDGATVASGRKFEGCPPTRCEDSLFGCCNDGETAASGHGEASKCDENKSCKAGKWGCCPDGRTWAQGPKKQGCFVCPEGVFFCDSCDKTEFGCCPDLQNAATGPSFEGCPDEEGSGTYEDCTLTEFGCCPDGITKAKGENFKGCEKATPCRSAKWGCCPDLLNPAHGPNKEGCCLNTEFGCCPDNTAPAQGPDNKGCGCEFTEFKCCPDDVTPARGKNFEGCGCVSTEFGCCPDKFTPSPGPDHQGCPCHTHEYGCCPDGESIARGPAQEGCTCKDREFGCCPDRRTPAQGVDFAGCGCAASEYGCCPDGNSTATGDNFQGCEGQELPEPPAEVCGLEKDRGPSRNFTVRWFFDMEYGGCARFWYGNEGGNRNNFETKEACNEVCVDPEGKKACNLPIVPGPCEGFYPRYGYNRETGGCKQFTYGGCLGNNNRFKSLEECEDTCVETEFKMMHTNKCDQPIETGPCQGNFSRWGYKKETEKCEEFLYGGCKGNLNSFLTETECMNSCGEGAGMRSMCLLPRSPGPCQDRLPKWYFDNFEKRCMPFYFGGCEGNGNKFDTEDECKKSCPSEFLQGDICQLEKKVGPCRDLMERFYFDSQIGTCQKFYFGGCEGNKNNFLTMEDCESRCSTDYSIPIQEDFKLEFCFQGVDKGSGDAKQSRWYYDHEDGVCKEFVYGGKKGNGNRFLTRQACETSCFQSQDICSLPKIIGPCNAHLEQFWYDKERDECFAFSYGGCQGNGNRFDTMAFCQSRCTKGTGGPARRPGSAIAPGVDICSLEMKPGPCTEAKPAWYYDAAQGVCTGFTYSGCEGNANRYESQEQCERQCGRFKNQDVCGLEKDFGPCMGRFRKFFYNSRQRQCEEFTYGGCEGNGNRFSSIAECEQVCLTQDEPEVSAPSALSKAAICRLPVDTGLASCSDSLERWYFDARARACSAFIYTGCAGNRNRFKTYEVCMGFCEAASAPPESPGGGGTGDLVGTSRPPLSEYSGQEGPGGDLDVDGGYGAEDVNVNCDDADRRCDYLRCPYGTQRYFDDRTRCEECFCNEPCRDFECPSGTSCRVEPYRARGDTMYRAVCRDDTKQGICPKVSRNDAARCQEECATDGDCSGEQKCCYNGCGRACMRAAKDPGMVDYEAETAAPQFDPNAPTVVAVVPKVTVPEGDVATLEVRVRGNPQPDVYWRKDNRRSSVDTNRGRFRLVGGGSLQIVGVRRDDAGNYECVADNGRGPPVTISVMLEVEGPRDLGARIMETDPNVVMSLGAPATLYCLAYGWPRPTVTWWKGTQMLPLSSERIRQEDDFTLRLSSVALSDLGPYTCQAYNGIGEAASFSIQMRVYGPVNPGPGEQPFMRYVVGAPVAPPTTVPPRPGGYRPTRPPGWDYSAPPPSTTQAPDKPRPGFITTRIRMPHTRFAVGSDVLIPCEVNSYTRPSVRWRKDGADLREDARVLVLRSNNTLAIYRAQPYDSGTYTCRGSNGYNEAEDSVVLRVENVQVQADCSDNPYFANCKLIVKARYCGNKYYAKFCCRSCTLAGQIPAV